ncbi:MAG: hypothetical protein ACI9PU_002591, partial [Ascidiaceihabitans sp.]
MIRFAWKASIARQAIAWLSAERGDFMQIDGTVIPPPQKKLRGCRSGIFSAKMHEEILMKMTRYSEPQILSILRQAEGG